jgi:inosine-uridine nucleoside N-ribohydrolase
VYRHPVAVHRSIGLDVTCRVRMGAEEVRRRFKAPRLAPVLDFAKVWFERVNTLTFHDPLAAATIFDDGVCGFERGRVDVELTGPRVLGMTHWTPDAKGPHHVALSVDPDRYLAHFFSIVGG